MLIFGIRKLKESFPYIQTILQAISGGMEFLCSQQELFRYVLIGTVYLIEVILFSGILSRLVYIFGGLFFLGFLITVLITIAKDFLCHLATKIPGLALVVNTIISICVFTFLNVTLASVDPFPPVTSFDSNYIKIDQAKSRGWYAGGDGEHNLRRLTKSRDTRWEGIHFQEINLYFETSFIDTMYLKIWGGSDCPEDLRIRFHLEDDSFVDRMVHVDLPAKRFTREWLEIPVEIDNVEYIDVRHVSSYGAPYTTLFGVILADESPEKVQEKRIRAEIEDTIKKEVYDSQIEEFNRILASREDELRKESQLALDEMAAQFASQQEDILEREKLVMEREKRLNGRETGIVSSESSIREEWSLISLMLQEVRELEQNIIDHSSKIVLSESDSIDNTVIVEPESEEQEEEQEEEPIRDKVDGILVDHDTLVEIEKSDAIHHETPISEVTL
ncbi:hypothetical protein ADUPG1_008048 [Aduncisulcus paluster]|uniref:F5/8 type C domain-containing protein n=1 Tax=Aduncisulcus paluster TaxID=2918883 RepID=A0ABQ5KT22_9EUKA|nr:hypothetical protein ADUPG1_008048 [Aduncisulcus paluster]